MNQKKIAIVANGDINWIKKSDLKEYSYIIGVDRAAYVLLKLGIIPNCAIGDFDSVSKGELEEIKRQVKNVKEYPADKDKTDLELAVSIALKQNPSEITIYGGTGRRLDHEIAALHLLHEIHKKKCQGRLCDQHNEILLIDGTYRIKNSARFGYLSVLPFSDEIVVSICGCHYPLKNHIMKRGTTLGVSNIITSDYADIIVHKGVAYCILSKDGG